MSAKEAYKAYVRAYDTHSLKTAFDVQTLDLAKVAYSFGFKVPPPVEFSKIQIQSVFFLFYSMKLMYKSFCRCWVHEIESDSQTTGGKCGGEEKI